MKTKGVSPSSLNLVENTEVSPEMGRIGEDTSRTGESGKAPDKVGIENPLPNSPGRREAHRQRIMSMNINNNIYSFLGLHYVLTNARRNPRRARVVPQLDAA